MNGNQSVASRDRVILANSHVRLEFEPEYRGLAAMVDLETHLDHISPVAGKHTLWRITLARGADKTTLTNTDIACASTRIATLDQGVRQAVFEWQNLDLPGESDAVSVRVTVELSESSGIGAWRIWIDNKSTGWGLWDIEFPILNGYLQTCAYDIAIPSGHLETWGALFRKCSERISRGYPYGWWMSMQFLSASRENNGVYMAAHDPGAWFKEFTIEPGTAFSIKTYSENMAVPGSDYQAPFPVMLGVYRGDWLKACKIYREFAVTTPWTSKGKLSAHTSTPQALKDIGLWFRVRRYIGPEDGTLEEKNEPLLRAQRFFDVPLGTHWYDWQVAAFDTQYPHFFPAKPGVPDQAADLVAKGVVIMPYINGRIIDKSIDDFDTFIPYCTKDYEGKVEEELYGNKVPQAPMCPYTEFWQNTVTENVRRLRDELGINAVYVDQIAASPPCLCFDRTHGHPLGGGSWWVDGYRRMLEKVQEVAHSKGKNLIITSECTAEPNMDGIDAFLTWTHRNENTIPMMPVVYAGYTIFFGSPESIEKLSDHDWRMAQGQEFLWGCQNGWMGLDLLKPEHERKAAYFKQLGKYHVAGKKFLVYGELVDLIAHEKRSDFRDIPFMQGAVWKAEDNTLGVFLANLQDGQGTLDITLDFRKYGLNASSGYTITRINPEDRRVVAAAPGAEIILTEVLDPWDIRFLEIKAR